MKPKPGDILYRAYIAPGHPAVFYDEFKVESLTPQGFYLVPVDSGDGLWNDRMWRSFGTRFASTTKTEALERLKARTRAYVRHSRRRLRDAEQRCADLGIEVPAEQIFIPEWYI